MQEKAQGELNLSLFAQRCFMILYICMSIYPYILCAFVRGSRGILFAISQLLLLSMVVQAHRATAMALACISHFESAGSPPAC